MKKLSIKMRITLWYSILMLVLVALVLGFMVIISDNITSSSARGSLSRIVEANMDELEYDDGEIDVDDDFDYVSGGVTCLIYTGGGVLVGGYMPDDVETDAALEDGNLRTITSNGNHYYIYDRMIRDDDGVLWIRGIIATDGNAGVIGTVTTASFILLPFIAVAAAIVGYQIAKRSFRPVDKIIQSANEISEGSDLSKRIDLGEGNDEIHRLANTFDHMFSRLETAFKDERQFTSDVSHELRTPTAVILSQCEYALAHASTEEEYREAVETIARQTERMSRLISQLLSFTRLERGVDRGTFQETNFSELVEVVCEEQEEIAKKHIALKAEIEKDIYARIDNSMIISLLSNLISNAYKYGRESGNILVKLQKVGNEAHLSVSDDGIGIPQESLGQIWNRFYQVDPSRATNENGSMGLGLPMVNQIARLHGGRMDVRSELGRGSTFTFIMPTGSDKN